MTRTTRRTAEIPTLAKDYATAAWHGSTYDHWYTYACDCCLRECEPTGYDTVDDAEVAMREFLEHVAYDHVIAGVTAVRHSPLFTFDKSLY